MITASRVNFTRSGVKFTQVIVRGGLPRPVFGPARFPPQPGITAFDNYSLLLAAAVW
jgi:hypothetical protein